jgi:hypothetical protein
MRTTFFAAGLALLTIALLAPPSEAQYYGGWKYMLIRTLGPPLINRGINYFMNHRGHVFDDSPQQQYSPPPSYKPYNASRKSPHPTRRTTVSHSVPPTKSHSSSSSPYRTAKLEVPPPPKMLVPPPPAGVPTGAVLGAYPADMNKLSSDVPPPPKITETPAQKKTQQ